MDTVITAGLAMVVLMAVDMAWAGVEVSGEALGQDMAGAEDMVEVLAGEGNILNDEAVTMKSELDAMNKRIEELESQS